ncbi:MAG: M14 family zinc carboxypeptidase [Candidatus Aminicenantes bacterium]|nr:M14 family zinc carboxypeptidase [Candidatus Aminicenantes bacterium]
MKQKKIAPWFRAAGLIWLISLGMTTITMSMGAGPNPLGFDAYHSPTQVNKYLETAAGSNEKITKLHKIAVSPGGRDLYLLEIGPETDRAKKTLPAIFVAANMEGVVPIATEAALYLAGLLLEQPEVRKDKTWYILPIGNPDAAARYFQKPLVMDARNNRPYNDDMDDRTDEDGVEDLDGNGIITLMRVKDPEGQWLALQVPGETGLMKQADWSKGEKGVYKLYTEGVDNDNDGQYNEDGPGGVDTGVTFPHLFPFFTPTAGPWALSEDESYNLVKFIVERPEIAMTVCFGETNFCLVPPRGDRKSGVDLSRIKVPEDIARENQLDPDRTYTMAELMEIARKRMPAGTEINETMMANFLGLGAEVNPLPEDLKFYNEISQQYKEFLKANNLADKRLEPAADKDGSFELWSYYHLGIPTFALDLWTPPELTEASKEPGEKEKNEVKNQGADPREKALLDFSTKQLGGGGFIAWKPFKHPTLGEVEIGGFAPYTANTPPPRMLENLLKGQVPWVFELVKKLPAVRIAGTEVKPMGNGLYRVKVWIENTGYLPYPTAMGKRNNRILPAAALLAEKNNYKIIEGKKRTLISEIPGHGVKMAQWILQVATEGPLTVDLEVFTPNAGRGRVEIRLENKTTKSGGVK